MVPQLLLEYVVPTTHMQLEGRVVVLYGARKARQRERERQRARELKKRYAKTSKTGFDGQAERKRERRAWYRSFVNACIYLY